MEDKRDAAVAPLSIGQLAERTGVAPTALRYYEQLGLVLPALRMSGRRRYAQSAVREVRVICFLREVGFSLAEVGAFLNAGDRQERDRILAGKVTELTEQHRRIEIARTALEHGRRCPADEPAHCPRFWAIIDGQQEGLSLADSHDRAHPFARSAAIHQ